MPASPAADTLSAFTVATAQTALLERCKRLTCVQVMDGKQMVRAVSQLLTSDYQGECRA